MLFVGHDASLRGKEAQAFNEVYEVCWRPECFQLVAVVLQAEELALRNCVCDPVLMPIYESAELLTSHATSAYDCLSRKKGKNADFGFICQGEKSGLL